ncbi:hypothetical protein GDO81_010034 [Engystomops pustulosus]|uniref:Uncharacterized protein n=1 Tax=Engystomops pustulosus TaxID=76066 RepID=A0AAV7BXF6_ENGPU|nr:hypothetical protein GDO81_010034 [Engystomops pustulosus]
MERSSGLENFILPLPWPPMDFLVSPQTTFNSHLYSTDKPTQDYSSLSLYKATYCSLFLYHFRCNVFNPSARSPIQGHVTKAQLFSISC